MKKILGQLFVKAAYWLVEHPDVIKGWVDAFHQAKQPPPAEAAR